MQVRCFSPTIPHLNYKMPQYTYECPNGHSKEIKIKYSELDTITQIECRECNELMRRVINIIPVHYRCNGFYTTSGSDSPKRDTSHSRKKKNI